MGIFMCIAGWPRGLVVKVFISKHFEYVQVNYWHLYFYSRVAKGGRNGGLFTLFSLYISIYLYPNRQHSWPRIHLIDLRSGTKLYSELKLS